MLKGVQKPHQTPKAHRIEYGGLEELPPQPSTAASLGTTEAIPRRNLQQGGFWLTEVRPRVETCMTGIGPVDVA